MRDGMTASFSEGPETLDVVGESHYQDTLWELVGGRRAERVRQDVAVLLVPEPDNPHDPNAISAWIGGGKVGYISRENAEHLLPGIYAMSQREGLPVGMIGVIAGGGQRGDALGSLGVFLNYDPEDFGLPPSSRSASTRMLTGESSVGASDERLRWMNGLRSDTLAAIKQLRELLTAETDPIERHYMFCELESRLYRSRDTFASALAEYDGTIRQHDAEMDGVRLAMLADMAELPVFETYKQAAIRHQKAKDFAGALWWAQRGLALYGQECARPEAVKDLQQRVVKLQSKLAAANP